MKSWKRLLFDFFLSFTWSILEVKSTCFFYFSQIRLEKKRNKKKKFDFFFFNQLFFFLDSFEVKENLKNYIGVTFKLLLN